MSQGEFANAIGGVSPQQVSDWESGKGLRSMTIALRLLRLLEKERADKARAVRRVNRQVTTPLRPE